MEKIKDIKDFLTSDPQIIWMIVVMGSVAVIGIVEFMKCWASCKKRTKWVVFFVSLVISVILSPITPPLISAIVMIWLLVLAVATICRNAIVDGLPNMVSKLMGAMKTGDTK